MFASKFRTFVLKLNTAFAVFQSYATGVV